MSLLKGSCVVVRIVVALLALLALSPACRRAPQTESNDAPPVAADVSSGVEETTALAAFEARGVAPPRTVLTREVPGELDESWIRMAIADARPVDVSRFESEEEATGDHVDALPREDGPHPATSFGESEGGEIEEFEEPELMLRSAAGLRAAEEEEDAPASEEGPGSGESRSEAPRRLDARLLTPPRIGKILVQNEEGAYESLVPRALRLQTFIDGPRARTIVDYVFSNPYDRRLQGTFYYPLAAGATPAAFGMFRATARLADEEYPRGSLLPPSRTEAPKPGAEEEFLATYAPAQAPEGGTAAGAYLVKHWGELQTARVVEQKRAREVYEEVVRRDIDPALLEWTGANTFQARVFPIEPRSVKRVVLVYEETLPLDGGLLRYSYPLPEAATLGSVELQLHLADAQVELRGVGGRTIPDLSSRADGWSRYALSFATGADASVGLLVAPRSSGAQVIESADNRGLPGSVFFARLRPPLEAIQTGGKTGRALLLVDTSLSREESGHGYSAELLESVLEQDETIEEYSVLLFDFRARWLHAPAWRPNDGPHREETLRELGRIYLEGATSFDATLSELDAQSGWLFEAGRPVHAFLFSDGFVSWGQDQIDGLAAKHPSVSKARWICYAFGSVAFNRDLFDALGRASAGRTVTILTRDELASAALAHRTAPAILDRVIVRGATAADLVIAGDPKLLFSGQELQIAGRIDPPAPGAELVVEARLDGEALTWAVPLRGAGDSALASRAWAELFSRKLLQLDDERLDRMLVALSQRFRLANRVASFLILDREEDYESFELKDEAVDLSALEKLRIQEEDQRRDRLQGIALDGVPNHAARLVALLGELSGDRVSRPPSPPFQDRPLAGGEARIDAEVTYREARKESDLNVKAYDAVARVRALAGDTVGALRAYSCLVEKLPANAEAARLSGYACMALGQFVPASELFERVRLNRPFEPQAYLEEALALDASGRIAEAARNYEIVLVREFPRHGDEARVVAAYQYARLLRQELRSGGGPAGDEVKELIERRLGELSPLCGGEGFEAKDLQVAIHWNTSSTDIDLWVIEPDGERCYYEHPETRGGGKLFWDITDGYGPELYQRPDAGTGTFEILIHYFGNNSARWSVPTAVLLLRDRGVFAPEDEFTRSFRMRLLADADAVLSLGAEEF